MPITNDSKGGGGGRQPNPVEEKTRLFLAGQNINFDILAKGQAPTDIGIACSDSRVPKVCEMNGIFWVTNPGGVLDRATRASVQYALEHIRSVKRISYFAHTKCGMLNAALSEEEFHGPLGEVVGDLRDTLDRTDDKCAMESHLDNSLRILVGLRKDANRDDVEIYGYVYHVEDGRIDLVRKV